MTQMVWQWLVDQECVSSLKYYGLELLEKKMSLEDFKTIEYDLTEQWCVYPFPEPKHTLLYVSFLSKKDGTQPFIDKICEETFSAMLSLSMNTFLRLGRANGWLGVFIVSPLSKMWKFMSPKKKEIFDVDQICALQERLKEEDSKQWEILQELDYDEERRAFEEDFSKRQQQIREKNDHRCKAKVIHEQNYEMWRKRFQ